MKRDVRQFVVYCSGGNLNFFVLIQDTQLECIMVLPHKREIRRRLKAHKQWSTVTREGKSKRISSGTKNFFFKNEFVHS